jgi:hypothetical protein
MDRQDADTGARGRVSGIKSWYRKLKEKGFFKYVGRNILLIIGVYMMLVFLVFLVGRYLVDFNSLFAGIFDRISDRFVLLLFLASESFTGMIPVDLFLVWTQKFARPLPWLALLGLLSYAGGIISYGIGLWISRRPRVRMLIERRLEVYIDFVRRWGGAFIIIAALFPFTPFSLVVIAVTMLRYPFKLFLLYGMTRLVRFPVQGVLFFDILKMDTWVI